MLEKDARLLRCCGPDQCGQLGNDNDTDRYCIVASCMAWRKTGVAKVETRRGVLADRDEDGTGRWHYDGYCGLAGAPKP